MAEDFNVKITTTGDPKGADQVAAGLAKVTKATTDNSKETRTLTQDVTSLGSRQNATKDVLEGLDSALKGNAMSMFGVAKAAKNLWEIFTVSTPAGRALQLAMIGVGTAAQFFGKETAAAGDTAKGAAGNLDAMREAAETFNKVRFDTLTAQLDALKAKGDSSLAFFKKLAELSKTLDDASMSLELAQLNANSSLSPEEKKARELAIRDRYGRRGLEREEGLRGEELNNLRSTAANTRAGADAAEAQRAMDEFLVSGLRGQRKDITARVASAELEGSEAVLAASGDPAAQLAAMAFHQWKNRGVEAERATAFSPGSNAYLKTLEDRLKAAEADAAAKKKQADEAQRRLDDALRISPMEQDAARTRADLEQRTRYTEAGLALPGIRRPPESDVRRLQPMIDSFTLQAMGREQGKSAGQILREYQAAWEAGLREEMQQRDVRIQRQ